MLGAAPILPARDLEGTTGCYLYVEDADALFAEFSRLELPDSGVPRLHGAPQDSDGNLLRIGSFIGQPG